MLKLSASSINDFKACPMRFYFNNILGIEPTEEKESLRVGIIWHKICELEKIEDVISYLDKVYTQIPDNKTQEEWLVERTILLYSLIGYKWYYTNQKIKRIATEIKFNAIISSIKLTGRIDEIIQLENGQYFIRERKSTSSEIDGSSDYWNRIGMDTQISFYLFAAPHIKDLPPISGLFYDIWHRPKIRPKKLTQAESKKFMETKKYYGQEFQVASAIIQDNNLDAELQYRVEINNDSAIIEPGAKEGTFAIYETPEMFGARLLEDITNRPEYYFQCREISRTDKQLQQFEKELQNLAKIIQGIKAKELWYCNEQSCYNRFRCDYTPICYNNIQIDINNLPDGFKIRNKK